MQVDAVPAWLPDVVTLPALPIVTSPPLPTAAPEPPIAMKESLLPPLPPPPPIDCA